MQAFFSAWSLHFSHPFFHVLLETQSFCEKEKKNASNANKQLFDEVFVISRIINDELSAKAEADNTYRDLVDFGYHKKMECT